MFANIDNIGPITEANQAKLSLAQTQIHKGLPNFFLSHD
jgi:hypothetical protein